jgi:NADP-dependent 3-hydroxy acid dehydrogenase YdfG
MKLALTARDKHRLAEIKAVCEEKGAELMTASLDVRAREDLAEWILRADDELGGIDLVIANAGVSEDMLPGGKEDSVSVMRDVMDINLTGVLNTIVPIIPRMRERKRGQIALMSSLASFHGIPKTVSDDPSHLAPFTYDMRCVWVLLLCSRRTQGPRRASASSAKASAPTCIATASP